MSLPGLEVEPTAPPRPLDIDLYCLTCGYNLRGLTGEVIRCPECGGRNPVGDVEVPAAQITAQLRRMETASAACAGALLGAISAYACSWWLVRDVLLWPSNWTARSFAFGSVIAAPLLTAVWVLAVRRFRRYCLAAPGWGRALLRYHLWGMLLCLVMLVAVFGSAWVLWDWLGGRTTRQTRLAFFRMGATATAVFFCLAAWFSLRGVHRWLNAAIHPLQRHVAIELARESMHKRMARAHGWLAR